ncbi:MAG TPA: dihydrofolate reductase family protein [Thermomicrobiaceae bacterium]|nr:dihydrofolate reductase family protein [Thermomicrobiaceae bacterium]
MGKVIADQSMSLDGFTTGPNVAVGNGMGDGGDQLHEWMFAEEDGAETNAGVREDTPFNLLQRSGAVVVGRRMFDVGVEPWGENPPFHQPVFVVTHRATDPIVKEGGTTYVFVTGGFAAALARAQEAAGGKDVVVLGGADVIRQFAEAGLLDELRLHLAHVLLGDGTRLFDRIDPKRVTLGRTRVVGGSGVTHLTFRLGPNG